MFEKTKENEVYVPESYSLEDAIKIAIQEAQHAWQTMWFDFNGFTVLVTKDSDPEKILAAYMQGQGGEIGPCERPRASPPIDQLFDFIIREETESPAASAAMEVAKGLDWTSLNEVIRWLESLSDVNLTRVSREKAIRFLEDAGYIDRENSGANYLRDDLVNSGRWLIGEALIEIKMMDMIHQRFPGLAKKWRERFHLS
ncbi:MAG: hypothetical protein A2017_16870 [Lentisphaerae bacterium GWF2_44_16]|nr:MAG: hypothetical protein A2017_16870 [Lentisphaerae bacterium GWF2_44_16]HAU66425.1 hypothetical protein [Candidatus Uhrbacteria bacterium]